MMSSMNAVSRKSWTDIAFVGKHLGTDGVEPVCTHHPIGCRIEVVNGMVVSSHVSACRAAYRSGNEFLKDVIFHKIVARHVGLNAVAFRYCVLRSIEIAV